MPTLGIGICGARVDKRRCYRHFVLQSSIVPEEIPYQYNIYTKHSYKLIHLLRKDIYRLVKNPLWTPHPPLILSYPHTSITIDKIYMTAFIITTLYIYHFHSLPSFTLLQQKHMQSVSQSVRQGILHKLYKL